ncbi:hypothetical protein ACP3T3_06875 [Chryseobacterium sp. CBSDS_008]|uniref:hypothetical protein n=1 Tax=Chryseobacterium sp. CBSDS_008 TaxID=3415265 RepID=UPI003CE6A578
MSPYAYTWNDPVNYTDPTGMMGERIGEPGGKNPDSFWHIIFWTKARRNAERYANSMRFGNNDVNVYKHDDGDWSVNTIMEMEPETERHSQEMGCDIIGTGEFIRVISKVRWKDLTLLIIILHQLRILRDQL